ncbi:MAG: hypothetical protein AAFV19_06090 [Pseudomonadota bacterium]
MFGLRISGFTGTGAALLIWTSCAHGALSQTQSPGADAYETPSGPVIIAQNGAKMRTPDVDTLTCDEMNQILMEISASGYRGVLVVSPDDPDYQIFAYENRLAKAHYQDCQVGVVDFTAPGGIFSSGFN